MADSANDAHLIQLVRSALGRKGLLHGVNVSSCKFVITLHGMVEDEGGREEIAMAVRSVRGVEDVVDKLRQPERLFTS